VLWVNSAKQHQKRKIIHSSILKHKTFTIFASFTVALFQLLLFFHFNKLIFYCWKDTHGKIVRENSQLFLLSNHHPSTKTKIKEKYNKISGIRKSRHHTTIFTLLVWKWMDELSPPSWLHVIACLSQKLWFKPSWMKFERTDGYFTEHQPFFIVSITHLYYSRMGVNYSMNFSLNTFNIFIFLNVHESNPNWIAITILLMNSFLNKKSSLSSHPLFIPPLSKHHFHSLYECMYVSLKNKNWYTPHPISYHARHSKI